MVGNGVGEIVLADQGFANGVGVAVVGGWVGEEEGVG